MIKVRQNTKRQINLYAKSHQYEKKKKQRKHRRGVSSPHAPSIKDLNNEMYFLAIKKQNSERVSYGNTLSVMPAMVESISAPNNRKQSQDISEFLHEWEIKQSVEMTLICV